MLSWTSPTTPSSRQEPSLEPQQHIKEQYHHGLATAAEARRRRVGIPFVVTDEHRGTGAPPGAPPGAPREASASISMTRRVQCKFYARRRRGRRRRGATRAFGSETPAVAA